jgi:cytochrome b6-f complex iron-sulfur subunit
VEAVVDMTMENPENAPAQPPKSKKDMTPEERAAAIKAAQEKAARLKAEREAAKAAAAAAEGGGGAATAVATAESPKPTAPQWRIPASALAGDGKVGLAQPDQRQVAEVRQEEVEVKRYIQRRQVLRGGVFAALGGFVILAIGSFLNFFNPRHIQGFGGKFTIPPTQVPKPGADPVQFLDAKTWLVNLKPGEGGAPGLGVPNSEKGGLLALYQKCPHLGCTVPWRADFEYEGTKGWFRCPCHGSTYTKGGGRVYGPAPRSMDTFAISFGAGGNVIIDTGKITLGDVNDPNRAVLPPA